MFYLFCVAHTILYLKLKICMFVGYIIDYTPIFFQIFLKLLNIFSNFLNRQEHWCSGAQNTFRNFSFIFGRYETLVH
jgi:hypothetical protein